MINEYQVQKVFTNRDYEPYAKDRDSKIEQLLDANGIEFLTFKDQVIFEKNEIVKDNGKFYSIFTPYSKTWLKNFSKIMTEPFPSEELLNNLHEGINDFPVLESFGFRPAYRVLATFPR